MAARRGALFLLVTIVISLFGIRGAAAGPYPVATCAHIAVSTTSPHPGQTITVTGAGFVAHEHITLELRSPTTVLAHVTTNADGAFSTPVTIPNEVTGTRTIVEVGGTSTCAVSPIQLAIQTAGVAGESTGLAFTGVDLAAAIVLAAALFATGAAALRGGRRRHGRPHRAG